MSGRRCGENTEIFNKPKHLSGRLMMTRVLASMETKDPMEEVVPLTQQIFRSRNQGFRSGDLGEPVPLIKWVKNSNFDYFYIFTDSNFCYSCAIIT